MQLCLISKPWLDAWKHFAVTETTIRPPGPITNQRLLKSGKNNQCKANIYQDIDYAVISFQQWQLLHKWYSGGPFIPRQVVDGEIDIWPIWLELIILPNNTKKRLRVTRKTKLSLIINQINQIDPQQLDVRILKFHTQVVLTNHALTVEQIDLDDGQKLIVEYKEKSTPIWPSSQRFKTTTTSTTPHPNPTGLRNLGNTCYMNASLQCLAHIKPLRDYFLTGSYVAVLRLALLRG